MALHCVCCMHLDNCAVGYVNGEVVEEVLCLGMLGEGGLLSVCGFFWVGFVWGGGGEGLI